MRWPSRCFGETSFALSGSRIFPGEIWLAGFPRHEFHQLTRIGSVRVFRSAATLDLLATCSEDLELRLVIGNESASLSHGLGGGDLPVGWPNPPPCCFRSTAMGAVLVAQYGLQ